MTSKTIEELVVDLTDAHFTAAVYANLTCHQKDCIYSCIKAALITGGVQVMFAREDNPLVRAMEVDAKEFEIIVDPQTDTTRTPSAAYPWGWRYEDDDVQAKFREFCQRKDVVVGYSPPVITNTNAT
jgi:hypothetical protein